MVSVTATRALIYLPTLADGRSASNQMVVMTSTHSTGFLSPPLSLQYFLRHRDSWKSASWRKIGPNATTLTTGEASDKAVTEPGAEDATSLPEIVKTTQEAWDKLEDKYAIASLAFAALLALYGSTGIISAIDRLPLLPSLFEIVGIGYTGWFAYRNLIFKPDREVLVAKVKSFYKDVI